MRSFILLCTLVAVAIAAPQPRTRGGGIAKAHTIPYMAFLEIHGTKDSVWYCGGTLISQNYILTSGNCVSEAEEVQVTLGAHLLSRPEAGKLIVLSKEITLHEQYYNHTNDIAVVKLPQTVTYSDTIQPVLLPKKSDLDVDYVGVTGKVSGWGSTDYHYDYLYEALRYAFVQVVGNQAGDCLLLSHNLPETMLCTSGVFEDVTSGPTMSDEGDPLVVDDVQIGIISFGFIDWWNGEPGAHVKVASYLDWIEANTDVVIN